MAVPHRALVIGVPEHLADRVEIDTGVDHEAGRAVSQIMNAQIAQPFLAGCAAFFNGFASLSIRLYTVESISEHFVEDLLRFLRRRAEKQLKVVGNDGVEEQARELFVCGCPHKFYGVIPE